MLRNDYDNDINNLVYIFPRNITRYYNFNEYLNAINVHEDFVNRNDYDNDINNLVYIFPRNITRYYNFNEYLNAINVHEDFVNSLTLNLFPSLVNTKAKLSYYTIEKLQSFRGDYV